MVLEECHGLIEVFVRNVQNIFVRCSIVGEIIGSNVFDILPNFLLLYVHCFRFI